MGAHDDLVDVLRREHVLHRSERLVVDDGAVRRDASEPKCREHAVEPSAGRGAARVAVHDVALSRLRHGRDDGHADRAVLGAAQQRVDELPPDERLVRDDEDRRDVRHA